MCAGFFFYRLNWGEKREKELWKNWVVKSKLIEVGFEEGFEKCPIIANSSLALLVFSNLGDTPILRLH